jgi:hypothetical protein
MDGKDDAGEAVAASARPEATLCLVSDQMKSCLAEMATDTLRADAWNRSCLTRLSAALLVGGALLLAGCMADGPTTKQALPFGNSARDELIRKQAQSNSHSTARQAEL